MTLTTVTHARHRAPTTNHPVKDFALDLVAGLFAVWMFIAPMLIVGTIIMAALLVDGGR